MQSYDDTLHPPMLSYSTRLRTISVQDMKLGQFRQRIPDWDQLCYSSRLREIQQANPMLTLIFEIREMRVAALRRDIESGHYRVKPEQVAEKIMEDQLLALFYS